MLPLIVHDLLLKESGNFHTERNNLKIIACSVLKSGFY